MKKTDQKSNSKYFKILGIILISIVFYAVVNNLGSVGNILSFVFGVLAPLFIGLCLAFILNLPLRFFENKVFGRLTKKNGRVWAKIKRPLCIILSILCIIAFLAILLSFIIPEFIRTCTSFLLSLPDNMEKLNVFIRDFANRFHLPIDPYSINLDWDSISAWALQLLTSNSANITQGAITIVTGVINSIVNFVLGFVFSIYVLASKEALGKLIKSFIYSTMKRENAKKLISVVILSNKAFSGFISGQCVECILIGVLCFIGMLIFQFPYALMVSCVISITAFIPVFGAVVGAIIGALLIFIVDPIKALWFIIYIIILQQIESNVLYPRIMGKHVGLPGIWVLIAVTVGGGLFGVGGIIFSVPLCSVLYTLFDRWIIKRLEERNICHRSMSHDSSEPKSIIEEITSFEFEADFSDDLYNDILEEPTIEDSDISSRSGSIEDDENQ